MGFNSENETHDKQTAYSRHRTGFTESEIGLTWDPKPDSVNKTVLYRLACERGNMHREF